MLSHFIVSEYQFMKYQYFTLRTHAIHANLKINHIRILITLNEEKNSIFTIRFCEKKERKKLLRLL